MAKAIATISGTALAPGVSLNRRLYTRQAIAAGVAQAQERISSGGLPLTMLTHHGAEDDSTRIVGRITSMSLAEDGSARFTADLADTDHGRTVAALVDSGGGDAFLRTVSIRGAWEGRVRRVTAPDGRDAEQGDRIGFEGIDLTKTPGVGRARIDAFSWASGGRDETTERVLITESVQEARVTATEETTPPAPVETAPAGPPEGARELLEAVLGPVREAGDATPAMSKRGSGMSGGGRKWADPGYQTDKKQRYDITTKPKALAAWRFINQASKAAKYRPAQLKNVKARIRSALKGFGVSVSTESAPGWGFEAPHRVSGAVAEFYGDPGRAGSWCVSASNGPVSMSLSSYSVDPADLDVILRAAADAACKALAALDPDMDGDVDVPGVGGNSDADGDAGPVPQSTGAAETGTGQPATERAPNEGTEAPVTTEAPSTTQGGGAPAATPDPAPTTETPPAATETDEQRISRIVAEAMKATGLVTPAPAPTVAETDEQRVSRLVGEALQAAGVAPQPTPPAPAAETAPPTGAAPDAVAAAVEAALAARGLAPPKPATETAEEKLDGAVTTAIQQLVESGAITIARGGIDVVGEHAGKVPDGTPENPGKDGKELTGMSEDELIDYAGGALAHRARNTRAFGSQPAEY